LSATRPRAMFSTACYIVGVEFEILEEIRDIEIIAVGSHIRDLARLQDDFIRIVDESGEDYLYHVSRFAFIELPEEVERALVAT